MPIQPMYNTANQYTIPRANQQNIPNPAVPYQPIGMIWVKGLQGVNDYPVARGATVPLFDQDEEVFYVKSVDMQGNLQPIKAFSYEEKILEQPGQIDMSKYVTVEEFNKLQEELEELKAHRSKPQYGKPYKKKEDNE